MELIGKDKEGNDVFVGSTVQYCWGLTRMGPHYKLHKITKEVKDNVIRYKLGTCYNSWNTSEVTVKSLDIPLETWYYYNEEGTPCLVEAKHFYKDDESYEKTKKEFDKRLCEKLFNIKL
jgi:hypothetical protein